MKDIEPPLLPSYRNWDTHIDHMISKASYRLYILRACRYIMDAMLFDSLIMSLFSYTIKSLGLCL